MTPKLAAMQDLMHARRGESRSLGDGAEVEAVVKVSRHDFTKAFGAGDTMSQTLRVWLLARLSEETSRLDSAACSVRALEEAAT